MLPEFGAEVGRGVATTKFLGGSGHGAERGGGAGEVPPFRGRACDGGADHSDVLVYSGGGGGGNVGGWVWVWDWVGVGECMCIYVFVYTYTNTHKHTQTHTHERYTYIYVYTYIILYTHARGFGIGVGVLYFVRCSSAGLWSSGAQGLVFFVPDSTFILSFFLVPSQSIA